MVKEQAVTEEQAAVEFQLARLEYVIREAAKNLRRWSGGEPGNAEEAVLADDLLRELRELRNVLGIAAPHPYEKEE
jgi:hypothetical protein